MGPPEGRVRVHPWDLDLSRWEDVGIDSRHNTRCAPRVECLVG